MTAIFGILAYVGTFAAGIGVRFGIVLLAFAAILVPALAVYAAMRGVAWARGRVRRLLPAGALRFRPGLLYGPGHTWVRPRASGARVGVDDLVRTILPWAVSVRLPRPGTALRAGEPAAVIRAHGEEAVVPAPIDGTVTGVNGNLVLDPWLLKSDAYARGWLFDMKPASDRLEGLRSGTEALAWMVMESDRLRRWLESETHLGLAAADGGELAGPVGSHLDPVEWKGLAEAFLAR
jgi:glycine cleavage system H protein